MKENNGRERRPLFRRSDRVIMIVLAAMILLSVVLYILEHAGLALIRGEIYMFLPMAMVLTALSWGAYAVVRRIQRKTLKTVVGAVFVLAIVVIMLFGLTYGSFVASLTLPQKFGTVTSPSGSRTLVVMRALDSDEERIGVRRSARLEADPDGDPEQIAEDWGYLYAAYPKALGVFYRTDANAEGEISIGYASEGTLMVEWLNDEAEAHFFVQNPGPGDGGEITVSF